MADGAELARGGDGGVFETRLRARGGAGPRGRRRGGGGRLGGGGDRLGGGRANGGGGGRRGGKGDRRSDARKGKGPGPGPGKYPEPLLPAQIDARE
jgi:hypothetical protein